MNINICTDIRSLYDELVLKEVVEEDDKNYPDGSIFRKDKVFVQSPTGKVIHTEIYPEDKLIDSMAEALNILNI